MKLVVDTDVARASGVSDHPKSSKARQVLDKIRDNGHSVIMGRQLKREWDRHRSFYSTRWLSSMVARKKVIFDQFPSAVETFVENSSYDRSLKDCALKDAHLIDAALYGDSVVFSNDNAAREAFCVISSDMGVIRGVVWFHSVIDSDVSHEYLRQQRYLPSEYYLIDGT